MKLWIAVHDPGSGSLFGMQTFVRRPLSTNKRKTNICACTFSAIFHCEIVKPILTDF